ncbi:MAG: carboxypeptidase-like regulatory domain-containing protein [Acidobacteriota bacterium]
MVPLVFALLSFATPIIAGEVTFAVVDARSGEAVEGGGIVLLPMGDGERLEVPGRQAALPEGSEWNACWKQDGFWARCEPFSVGPESRPKLLAWPSRKVSGSLRKVEGAAPEQLLMRFSAVAPKLVEKISLARVPCLLEEKSWTCEVPAVELDLELRATGFVPHYRFGVDMAKDHAFGAVDLKRGSSLVGEVRTEDRLALGREGRAKLYQYRAGRARSRFDRPVQESPVLENGFFQLGGLAAGVYVLEVERPGYVPAEQFPIEIWESVEVRLQEALTLRRPLALALQIVPATDWAGRPWTVRVSRGSELSASMYGPAEFDGQADELGRVVVENQGTGIFAVSVEDGDGSSMLYRSDIVLERGGGEVVLELDQVVVRGELRFRDGPIAGAVRFRGGIGASVQIKTDREGAFLGVVPEEGWWTVEVEVPELFSGRIVQRVEVEADSRGEARIELELPDTELRVRVVDRLGSPVEGANVSLLGAESRPQRAPSDAAGEVVFRGASVGEVLVGASDDNNGVERTSDGVVEVLREGLPVGPVELVLREAEGRRGRVVSERGGVPGARVLVGIAEPTQMAFIDDDHSDREGRFEFDTLPGARVLWVVVSPPGHALLATRMAAPAAEEDLTVAVPVVGGTLHLVLGDSDQSRVKHPRSLGLSRDGHGIPWGILANWARAHGEVWGAEAESVVIPQLAPGTYRACWERVAASLRGLNTFAARDESACAEVFLSAGGTATLDISKLKEKASQAAR